MKEIVACLVVRIEKNRFLAEVSLVVVSLFGL